MSRVMPGRAYGYRWVVLAALMAVNLTIQLLWISYAAVSAPAARYFGVSEVAVGALAMTFMVAYIPLSLPASFLIDRRGLRVATGAGALLAGVAGVARGLAGDDFTLVLAATVAAAVAQPFLLNAWTTVSVRWFPRRQRATAVSLVTLANLVGTGAGLALTPALVDGLGPARTQLWYGGCALVAALFFVLVVRERPPVPPEPAEEPDEGRALMLDGVRHALRVRPFVVFLGLAFLGMGVFNGLSTWVDAIVRPRGLTTADAGNLGALLLLGGVIGAVVLSALSDRTGRRVPFLGLALTAAAPALLGVALLSSVPALFASAFVLGFFMTSAMPVGMQYSAEITAPTPEGTSNGLVQLVGQLSVVFVALMALTRTSSGSFVPSLVGLAVLLLGGGLVALRLPEPAARRTAEGVVGEPTEAPAP